MILYSVRDKHESGTGFYVSRHITENVLDFAPVSERICIIKVKLTYYNFTLISTHAPTEEKVEVVKKEFYSSLEKVCDAVPNDDIKTLLGDFSAKVGKESYLYPACGGHSIHNKTNDNGK
jgi:Holliday junction resolvase